MVIASGIPSTLQDDYRYCREIVAGHEENFPVGSFLAPARMRAHLHAVYAFARTADDFADKPGRSDEERLRLLDDWERRLELAISGAPDHPIFRALAHTLQATELPIQLLADLLAAFRMDVEKKRYQTIRELDDYCRLSANPVGRIVLHLAGEASPEKNRWSDAICTALQLANHWQDLGEDPWNGRPLYLPEEEMARYGVTERMILERSFSAGAAEMMLQLVEETRALFRAGEPLIPAISWPLRLEMAVTWEGGMMILDKVEALGGNTLRTRPRLDKGDRRLLLWRGLRHALA